MSEAAVPFMSSHFPLQAYFTTLSSVLSCHLFFLYIVEQGFDISSFSLCLDKQIIAAN